VDYLLEHAGRYLNRQPQRSDILSHFAGLRPLVGAKLGSRATSKLSREHEIYTSDSGLITVIGGKWTTYRKMGEDLIDHAERSAGLQRRTSRTAELPLHGCPTATRTLNASNHADVHGTDRSRMEDLIRVQPELSQQLHPKLPYQAVDVIWAARHEMARSVEDVLARRTRALLLDARASMESAPFVAELLVKELGRDTQWQQEQITGFCQLATATYLADAVVASTDRVNAN
jgi:glycerol-3-phosphate dehydrogenase